jgi:lipoprotein-releasing system ATP-binding protein
VTDPDRGGNDPVVEASGLSKTYRRRTAGGEESIRVLDGAEIRVLRGERVAVQGDSGVGKTTLLNLLGGLDRPDGGELRHLGIPLPLDPASRARWRRNQVGFIFQFHGLLAEFTAVENVALAGLVAGWARPRALAEGRALLGDLGLAGRVEHYPGELSGGEQQRVAVARALLTGPSLVLADEPTGNLDPRTGDQVLDRLLEHQERHRFALVVATHSARLAARCHRVLRLVGGRLGVADPDDYEAPRHEAKVNR